MGRRQCGGVAVGTCKPVPDLAPVAGWLMCCVALRIASFALVRSRSREEWLVGLIDGSDYWRKRGSQ
jgi:hypothetical protein